MDERRAQDLVDLLDEVVWEFGGQGPEGYCCEDISYVEYRALRVLSKSKDCTVRGIGEALGFTKSGATRVVDRLERKGYAHRKRNEVDHRVCCVVLTDEGRSLVERILEGFAQKIAASLDRMDKDMGDVLLSSLRSLVATFHN
jgi:DNA-binding MarR family transcriptional regulator